MKKIKLLVAITLLFAGTSIMAQEVKVNVEKSSIEWLGKKIGGEHDGAIQLKSGSFMMKDDMIASGSFIVDMTSITNFDIENEKYNQQLVGHLKSDDFFGVEKYPTAEFVVVESTKFVDGKAELTGDITIKGKTERITFDVVRKANEFVTKFNLDRSKFDVRYGSKSFFDNLGDKVIDDMFTLDISFVVE